MENARSESGYEWDAEAYHAMSDPQYDLAMDLLESLELMGDETVIDAGCGSGRVSVEILARLPRGHLLAVDLSHNMLEFAEKVLVAQPGQTVDVLQADLQTFTRPGIADGIFSSSTLHFVKDHKTLFENLHQSLKPHGWIALQFGSKNMANNPMLKQINDVVKGPTFGKYNLQLMPEFYGADGDSTYANLQAAGFTEIVVEETDVVMDFAHDHRMERLMRSALSKDVLNSLPSDSVREDLLRQLAAILNNDTVMREPMTFTRVHARSSRPM
jgi:trans-aconitate 2-methyltransferase